MYNLQRIALFAVLISGSAFAISACSGSTGPAGAPGATGATGPSGIAPTPQSTPAANPASMTLNGAGSTAGFTVSEANYTGTLTAANGTPSCAGITTFSPSTGGGPVATFVVTAVAPGICQIKVSDSAGNAAAEQVTVNAASSPPAGTVTTSPSSMTLTGAGSQGGFTATEAGYTGTLTAANGTPSCSGIATFSPSSGTGPNATFVVTAVAPGICQIKVSDASGNSGVEQVTVNAASGSGSSAMTVSTSSLAFTAAGAAGTFTVNENNYTGNFTAANGSPSCAGIATFSPATAAGPTGQFTVTAVAAGTCQIKVTDSNGQTSAVTITVTTTSGSVS
jgi:hypothetical protein